MNNLKKILKRAEWWQLLLLPLAVIVGLLGDALSFIISIFRRMDWYGRVMVALVLLIAGVSLYTACKAPDADTAPQEYISTNEHDNMAVEWEALTTAWATEAGYLKRYNITDTERQLLASVITAEAEGEPFAGKVAVAQCILQACEDDQIRPDEALKKYGYSKHRPDPCEEALEAVQTVFDHGDMATAEPIKYYYAPALVSSEWHETQIYVMTINGHKFFKEKGATKHERVN